MSWLASCELSMAARSMKRRDSVRSQRTNVNRRSARPRRQSALADRRRDTPDRSSRPNRYHLSRHRQESESALGASSRSLSHSDGFEEPQPWLGCPGHRRATTCILRHSVRRNPVPIRPLPGFLVGARTRRPGRHRQRRALYGALQLRHHEQGRTKPDAACASPTPCEPTPRPVAGSVGVHPMAT